MSTSNWQLRKHVRDVLTISAVGFALQSNVVLAQSAPAEEIDTVVVTGSYIRGAAEQAALPVDVITNEDLEKQGSPSVVQLVKTITASTAGIGESNRYVAGAGTANINLRGLGTQRTLTLLNNHRLVDNPLANGQNLNSIPLAAVGRVEVLKEGAAATYGSDAIGGVVNFFTRTDLDGLELAGQYAAVRGSDDDYEGSIAWGSKTDTGNFLIAASYRHRSRMDIRERDWAHGIYLDSGYGGWTGNSNPGNYIINTTGTTQTAFFRDNGCQELGGVLVTGTGMPTNNSLVPTAAPANGCRFEFSEFNDLVNREEHYQFYTEFNGKIGDSTKVHTELLWARDFVPMQRLSPANGNTQFPTPIAASGSFPGGGTSGTLSTPSAINGISRYNVPWYNPGLQDLIATCAARPVAFGAGQSCATLATAGQAGGVGVDIQTNAWRAITFAGHPTNDDKADHQVIDSKAFRISNGLSGEFLNIGWDATATYMQARGRFSTNDLLVDRLQLAMNGFGSLTGAAPCQATTQAQRTPANAGNAAIGCYFFNPFTNSVAVSAVNGQANPYYRGNSNAAVINNPRLVEWMYGNYINEFQNELGVFDGVLNGKSGINLPGGEIAWAFGVQYRRTRERQDYGDLFNNKITPCVDSIDDGLPLCNAPNGPFIFFGSGANTDESRNVYATFAEVSIPILDTLEVNVAGRYEAYPGNIGSTTDPKVAVRWQTLDWLAFRATAGTTFRAPPANTVTPGCVTGVVNISNAYRAQITCGNPDLKPESADAYNFGVIFNPGDFTATLDYYYFDFKDELTTESAGSLFTAMFPTAASTANCVPGVNDALRARFTFAGACGAANVSGVTRYNVNGPGAKTSGFDLRLEYNFRELLGGALLVGMDATYIKDYRRGAFTLKDNPAVQFAAPVDRAGKTDLIVDFFSYPKLKGNFFASYTMGDLTARWQGRFSQGTEAAVGSPRNRWVTDASGNYFQEIIGKTANYWQHDLIVRYQLPWETSVTASVMNVFDKDPPFVASNFNYDYFNGNPLGRVVQVAIKQKF